MNPLFQGPLQGSEPLGHLLPFYLSIFVIQDGPELLIPLSYLPSARCSSTVKVGSLKPKSSWMLGKPSQPHLQPLDCFYNGV